MDDCTTDPAETEIVRAGMNAQFPIRPIRARRRPGINKKSQLNSNEPINDEFHHSVTGLNDPIVNSSADSSGSGSNSYSQKFKRAQEHHVSGNFRGAITICWVSINASDVYLYFTN